MSWLLTRLVANAVLLPPSLPPSLSHTHTHTHAHTRTHMRAYCRVSMVTSTKSHLRRSKRLSAPLRCGGNSAWFLKGASHNYTHTCAWCVFGVFMVRTQFFAFLFLPCEHVHTVFLAGKSHMLAVTLHFFLRCVYTVLANPIISSGTLVGDICVISMAPAIIEVQQERLNLACC